MLRKIRRGVLRPENNLHVGTRNTQDCHFPKPEFAPAHDALLLGGCLKILDLVGAGNEAQFPEQNRAILGSISLLTSAPAIFQALRNIFLNQLYWVNVKALMGKPAGVRDTMNRRFYGVLVRKECWRLSWRGWLVALTISLLIVITVLLQIHPFLAVTHRVPAKVLVVEGWIHPFAMDAAVKEFKTGHYDRVFVTGGPAEGSGGYSNDYNTEASVGADLLRQAGIPAAMLQMVPSHVWNRSRTYYSAIALRDWFQGHNVPVRGINVLTENAHARRTWLLFQEALGKNVKVGIISIPNPDYDAGHWWRYSEGVREVIGEAIAYVYAKFFFWPG